MKERPHELPADIFEAKLKMSVLVNGVMSAIESRCADIDALLFCDLFGLNQSWRITSPRGSNCGIIRMQERVAQSDARRCVLNRISGPCGSRKSHKERTLSHWKRRQENPSCFAVLVSRMLCGIGPACRVVRVLRCCRSILIGTKVPLTPTEPQTNVAGTTE